MVCASTPSSAAPPGGIEAEEGLILRAFGRLHRRFAGRCADRIAVAGRIAETMFGIVFRLDQ